MSGVQQLRDVLECPPVLVADSLIGARQARAKFVRAHPSHTSGLASIAAGGWPVVMRGRVKLLGVVEVLAVMWRTPAVLEWILVREGVLVRIHDSF
jgi:hypothetical protein